MRYLILIVILFIPAWGWAEEFNVTRCVIADNWESPTREIPCDAPKRVDSYDCSIYQHPQLGVVLSGPGCQQQIDQVRRICEQRMREAMRGIDQVLKWNHDNVTNRKPGEARITMNIGGLAYYEWRDTMKDCVEGQ